MALSESPRGHHFKNELVHHHTFQSREEARTAVLDDIETYNRQRWHQRLGYLAPAEYERRAGVST